MAAASKIEVTMKLDLGTIAAIESCERERIIGLLLRTKPYDIVESVDEPQGVRFSMRKLQALVAPAKQKAVKK